MGMASNCTGTVHDVAQFAKEAKAAGALVYLDAVQYAPHYAIDVQTLNADFVVSSAYKWFGPHMGILWGRKELLLETFGYKVFLPLKEYRSLFQKNEINKNILSQIIVEKKGKEKMG